MTVPRAVVTTMCPSSPFTCQSCVTPVTAVLDRRRRLTAFAPTCTKPPSGSHTPTYLTISPRSVLGISGWTISVALSSSGANAPAWPPTVLKLSDPTSSRRALWVNMPEESATHISSTRSSSARARRRLLDSSGSLHHGCRRIWSSLSRTSIAWRIMRLSMRSRMAFSTSRKELSMREYASLAVILVCSTHVKTMEATNATSTAPTSCITSFRWAVIAGPPSRV